MGTVTVNGNTFSINGDLPGAKVYLSASLGADAWNALATDDLKGKYLVAATRLLYTMPWMGTPTVAAQTTAFPRNGVMGVVDGTTPDDVKNCEYELAAWLVNNPGAATATASGSNTKKLEAGPVSIEYFHATDALEFVTPLPKFAMDLVGKYMVGADDSDEHGSTAYGVDPCTDKYANSQFEDCDEYTRLIR